MKKRKLLTLIFSVVGCFTFAFGLSACGLSACEVSSCKLSSCDSTDPSTPAHTHSYTQSIVAPTCTEKGYTKHTCSCGDTYSDTYVDALGHSFIYYVSNDDATCEVDGTETAGCENGCGVGDMRVDEGSAFGHSFTNYESNNDATCEVNGTETAICDNGCGEDDTREDEDSALGHSFTNYVSNSDGTETAICDNGCGKMDTIVDESYYTEGLVFTLNNAGDAYTVTYYTGMVKKVYIPATYENLPVTSIGNSAFYNCDSLTEIVISDGVTTIGDFAFYECTKLTKIVIPDSVTKIGNSTFYYCYSLTDIVIPNSVTTIADRAFQYCSGLTEIVIPDSVMSIGYEAFRGCSKLGSITLPFVGESKEGTSNTHFGYIFGASSYGSNNSYVPTSLKKVVVTSAITIDYDAFRNCDSLTKIVIPDSVTTLGENAFNSCNDLESVTFGENSQLATISSYAFYGCDRLTEIVIPDSVTTIGKEAFYNCSSLTEVVIGDSVTTIGYGAFEDCEGLTKIVIPASVTTIGERAFADCSSLTGVYITDIEAWCNISFGNSSANPLYNAGNLYLHNELVSKLEIPDTITEIKDYAFYRCSSLMEIVIPDSVTTIGNDAFCGCDSLTEIVIPNNVTTIGEEAFSGCDSLTEVVIGDNVTTIGKHAFENCSKLKYNVYDNAKYLGSENNPYLYLECATVTSIPSVAIYKDCKIIAFRAFYNCSRLTEIVIPNSVTSIGSYAFRYCDSLESITLPFVGESKEGTENTHFGYIFGAGSYKSNSSLIPTSLKKVVITSATKIDNYAFYECTKLTEIVLPGSVTTIGNSAFYKCYKLAKIVIPEGVTSIDYSAFYNCDSLTEVVIPNSVTTIGNAVFYDCNSLTIYCRASSKPSGWVSNWNSFNCPVVWGYKGS